MIILITAFTLTAIMLFFVAWKSLRLALETAIFVALLITGLLALIVAGLANVGALI